MIGLIRSAVFAIPFGATIALATHLVRFGDDHEFGGDANPAIVTLAIGGALALTLAILHVFLARGTTIVTGTLARERLRALVPHPLVLGAIAACAYYGIEGLEGHAPEIGPATLMLALFAWLLGNALRALAAVFARFTDATVRAWIAQLDARTRALGRQLALGTRPLHPQLVAADRRFGRAPPNGRRFP